MNTFDQICASKKGKFMHMLINTTILEALEYKKPSRAPKYVNKGKCTVILLQSFSFFFYLILYEERF